jgi:signal peptidase II
MLAADSLVKQWIERWLSPGDVVPVVGQGFQLTLSYNTGVAFGMFGNGGNAVLILTGTIILMMAVWVLYSVYTSATPRLAYLPMGLLLGGAIANFVDRAMDGRVTDFLDIGLPMWRWPTFNLADCGIVVGVSLLMLLFGRYRRPQAVAVGATRA